VHGRRGALLGGVAFIVPGLILILALSALFPRRGRERRHLAGWSSGGRVNPSGGR